MKKLFGLRIFALLLCIALAAAVFTACDSSGGGGDTTESISVSNAVILTPASADSDTTAAAQILVDALPRLDGKP